MADMARRQAKLPEMPPDPALVIRTLRVCRKAMVDVHRSVKIGGSVYVASGAVMTAIDVLAGLLTGDREYFWAGGAGATEAQRDALKVKAARERGDIPWER